VVVGRTTFDERESGAGVGHSIEGEVDMKSIFKRLVKPVTLADGAIPEVARAATSGVPALGGQLRQGYALLLASFVATSAIACGAEDPSVMDESESDVGKIAQDITGGTLVADNNAGPRSSVVKIQIGGVNGGTCTGLKVGPLLYLTANHCGFVQGQLVTTTNALGGNSTNDHSIVQVFDHPTDFLSRVPVQNNLNSHWDLTLLQVDYDDGIPVHTPNYLKQSVGDTGTFFGYGCDNVNPGNAGKKQFGTSSPTVNSNSYPSIVFRATTQPQICPGDSGGPFFKQVNGVFRLEGMNRAFDGGTSSWWNRIYGASQWIDAVRAGLPGINVLTNGSQGTFLSKTSDFCMGSFFTQQVCSFLESADQRFTVVVSGGNLQFVGQGANAGQCLGVNDTFSGTAVTHVTCGTPASNWTIQNTDASGKYKQFKNVFAQHCMRSVSLGTDTGYDQQPCSNPTAYPDQFFVFSK
jgi:V8-like Glu-specific endopeptidase